MTGSKTILVTGGCGFIGSHFIREFLKKHRDFRLVNFDKLTYAGNPENLKDVGKNKNYVFVRGDISNQVAVEKVFKKYKPDYVINFAAESHVDRSIHGHAKDFVDTNIQGVFNLLESAKRSGVKKFVQVSTDEVYGSLDIKSKAKFTEKTQYNPRSPYSASKAAGDLMCHAYFATYGLPVIVTHCSNNYGTHQYPEKLIPSFALKALSGKPLPLYGDGKNVRDWIHVLDHVAALDKIILRGRPGETYNIGGNQELANIKIAQAILRALKKPISLIKYVPDRPGHDRRYAIDDSKLRKELDWKPKHSLEKNLVQTVVWYKDNPKWVESAVKRLKKVNPHIKI